MKRAGKYEERGHGVMRIRLSMNPAQEAFAHRFEIALGTLRDWERGARIPDSTAEAYPRVIERPE